MDAAARREEPAPLRTVAIAGLSGFVGRALAESLAGRAQVVGLGRGEAPASAPIAEWRTCDLFSLLDAEKALRGAEVAVYLVHSMLPSATLSQGNFEDFDLIAADNFARAAAKAGVRRIVYLGGLIPEESGPGAPALSPHLASRLEVEHALGAYGTPVIALRAGMVIGAGGSSFEMMMRLVERLPWMLTPRWTSTRTQPIALADVVALLARCIEDGQLESGAYDIGGPEVLTYQEMIARAAAVVGKHPKLIPVPLVSPAISRLWVSLITGAPLSLVAPLVESLRHEMVARDRSLQERCGVPGLGFEESIRRALAERARLRAEATQRAPAAAAPDARAGGAAARSEPDASDAEPGAPRAGAGDGAGAPKSAEPAAYQTGARHSSDRYVRSVQRLPLPAQRSALWAGEEYMRWLPRVLPAVLKVTLEGDDATFRLFGFPLLVLGFARERSGDDRSLFYIRGGLLARALPLRRGRFEFRAVPGGKFVLAAVHDFEPALPWLLYAWTQAKVHLMVMRLFGRHLRRLATAGG